MTQKLQISNIIKYKYYRISHFHHEMESKQFNERKLKKRKENEESDIENKGIWSLI